jgi:hypothetical protein
VALTGPTNRFLFFFSYGLRPKSNVSSSKKMLFSFSCLH